MQTVFMVLFDVEYEGSSVEKICATEELAVQFVTREIQSGRYSTSGKWRQVSNTEWQRDDLTLRVVEREVMTDL